METPREQALQRRQRILASARRCLAERGYEGLTMRGLAEASGVSVPTLYNAFGSKHALVRRAVESHLRAAILDDLDAAGVAGHLRLLRVIDLCADDLARLPDYYRQLLLVFSGETRSDPAEDAPLHEEIAGAVMREVERALGEMQQSGELEAWVEPAVFAQRFFAETMVVSIQWASRALSAEGYRAALVYTTGLMLLGVTRGAAREDLRRRVEAAQPEVALLPRAPRLDRSA